MTSDEKKRLPWGGGGIDEPTLGRFRVRVPTEDGGRKTLGIFDSYEEALDVLNGWRALNAAGEVALVKGVTLVGFGEKFLERRITNGLRAKKADKSRWGVHIATAKFATWPMAQITRADITSWLDSMVQRIALAPKKHKRGEPLKRPSRRETATHKESGRTLSRSTVKKTLNLLRVALADAKERGLIPSNPAFDVKFKEPKRDEGDLNALSPDEIDRLVKAVRNSFDPRKKGESLRLAMLRAEADAELVRFAIGGGMREGEIHNLYLHDAHTKGHEPYVFVRWAAYEKGQLFKPKNGESRRMPLFGIALDALKRWLELLPEYAKENPLGLVFPTPRGKRRGEGKAPRGWKTWLKVAGITRRVRFHDLRHTCATGLLSGYWGRRWTLAEVQKQLGHLSAQSTEIYAHLTPSAHTVAALETHATWVKLGSEGQTTQNTSTLVFSGRATQDSNLRPLAPEAEAKSGFSTGETLLSQRFSDPSLTQVAEAVLLLARDGDEAAHERANELAEGVLDTPAVRLALEILDGGPTVLDRAIDLAKLVLLSARATRRKVKGAS